MHATGTRALTGSAPLTEAQDAARQYARYARMAWLADRAAPWREAPISTAQRQRLTRFDIRAPSDSTRGAASDLLTLAEGAQLLDSAAA